MSEAAHRSGSVPPNLEQARNSHDPRLVELARFFPLNPTRYGTWSLKTRAAREGLGVLTLDRLDRHVNTLVDGIRRPAEPVGQLPAILGSDGEPLTTVGLLDFDGKDSAKAYEQAKADLRAVQEVADRMGFQWATAYEVSHSGKGFHAFLFLTDPVPFETMARMLRGWLRLANVTNAEKTETFPLNNNEGSVWYRLPYANAAAEKDGLGRTYLCSIEGDSIPYGQLSEYIDPTAATEDVLAELLAAGQPRAATATQSTQAGSSAGVKDLSPEGFAPLKNALLKPPEDFQRHDSIAAALNIAERMGRRSEMLEHLHTEGFFNAWVTDGSRTFKEWTAEVTRWAKADPPEHGGGYGLDFLRAQGFTIPSLPNATPTRAGAARPPVIVTDKHLSDIADEVIHHLQEGNNPPRIFERSNNLMRVIGTGHAERMTATAFKGYMDRNITFLRLEKDRQSESRYAEVPARPPQDLAPDILSLPEKPFPTLEGFAHTPVFLPGGKLLDTEGYDAGSGLLLQFGGLKNLRTNMPLAEALAWLDDLIGDFPFADDDAGRAHIFAALLQPFVRSMIDGATPMLLIDAPARSSGKGLLAEVIALVTMGEPAHVMHLPRDGDELEKRLTALLLEGYPLILLDNVTRLDQPSLMAVLTTTTWRGRVLGRTEMAQAPNTALWIATGNNVELADEMVRRVYSARLDPGVERPEERTGFKHSNLPKWARDNRANLVSACLSLVQHWVAKGMPAGTETLGRYESWTEVIGGILTTAGVPGFLTEREALHQEGDQNSKQWAALVDVWQEAHGHEAVTASDVFNLAQQNLLLLNVWSGRNALGARQRFGHALARQRDRVYGSYRITPAGKDGVTRVNAYALVNQREQTTTLGGPENPPPPNLEADEGLL